MTSDIKDKNEARKLLIFIVIMLFAVAAALFFMVPM